MSDKPGFLEGLTNLLAKLGELAEKGEELKQSGELPGSGGKLKGVYGLNVRFATGGKQTKVEPFGNIRQDRKTGQTVMHDVREPLVDVFDEGPFVLVVAELPGAAKKDVMVELRQDVLTLRANRQDVKYEKEVLLSEPFDPSQMTWDCRNGILEVRLNRQTKEEESGIEEDSED